MIHQATGIHRARPFFRLQLKGAAVAAALTALAGLLGLVLPWPGPSLIRLSYELPLLLSTPQTPAEAVVVYLDDESHQQLSQRHRAPWDRRLHAQLITNLLVQGARVVALDIVFDEPGSDPSADAELARAVASGGRKVVLGALLDESQPGIRRLELPLPALRNLTNDNWGVANLWEDPDGVVRRHFHFDPEWRDLRSLSWRVATRFQPDLETALDPRDHRFVRYYGPPGTLARLSYFEAINPTNRATASLVRGRAVFIGAGSAVGYTGELKESVPTPYSGLDGARGPKLDVHATQFLNLVRNEAWHRPSARAEILWIVGCGVALGLALKLLASTPLRAAGTGAALVGLVTLVGVQSTLRGRLWWSWAVVAVVQVPIATACALAARRSQVAYVARTEGPTAEFKPEPDPGSAGATLPAIPMVPDHEIIRCIGQGSYGEVWLARTAMGAFRAVKLVRRRAFGEDRQFDREFSGLEKVEPISRLHEGLVDILQVGRGRGLSGDFLYYVMELADDLSATSGGGVVQPDRYQPRTLRSLLDQGGPVPREDCLRIGLNLADALAFLHASGLVHRDIKPANIVFVAGRPRLADIGLIAGMNEGRSLVGTVGYLPPEGPGTARADIFSLGMVLYELATGLHPMHFPAPSAESTGVDRSDQLLAVILRLCAPNPDHRPPSAIAVRWELERLRSP